MKKTLRILAIVMALALLGGALASAESAATCSNGQSPQQPYKGVPPVDLTKKLGYMVLDPLNNENVSTAINSLVIYLPRTDVQAGDGSLRLYEKGVKAPIQEVSFADSARVTAAPRQSVIQCWRCCSRSLRVMPEQGSVGAAKLAESRCLAPPAGPGIVRTVSQT